MRVTSDLHATVSSERERTERRVAGPAFADALRRADRRQEAARRPATALVREPREGEPCCPACGSTALEAEEWISEDGGMSFSVRPLDAEGLAAAHRGFAAAVRSGALVLAGPPATILAPTETATLLASALLDARWLLDRHRRFDLEVAHPVHGFIRLRGHLRGARLQVAYQARPEARRHLEKTLPHLQDALAHEGLELVSFLPEEPRLR
ncbi:MAG: flagellar hook-length control protein FliK [Deltaproteobacteria bacterium]|nr:flagellar hook-length control protein FliK [Deltaproteobacteria bacterium]